MLFFGIEITLVDVLVGGGLGIVFCVLTSMFLREQTERGYQEDRAEMYRYQSASVYDNLQVEIERREALENGIDFLVGEVGELEETADDLVEKLGEAHDLFQEQERQIDNARTRADLTYSVARRLAAKLDSLGVKMTHEEIVGWGG